MPIPKSFLDRAADPSPSLQVKFWSDPEEKPLAVQVEHRLGKRPSKAGRDYLKSLAEHRSLREFIGFYKKHNGFQFCRTFDSGFDEVRPLLEFKPAESIASFTDRYSPNGDLAWTMDLNKSKNLYRGSARWLAFAQIDSGTLTIFLDGDHAGCVFFVTPQPWFNILRPIAKGFNALLDRIANDIPAFLRLVRATVTLRGIDGYNYGMTAVEYRPSQPSKQLRQTNLRFQDT